MDHLFPSNLITAPTFSTRLALAINTFCTKRVSASECSCTDSNNVSPDVVDSLRKGLPLAGGRSSKHKRGSIRKEGLLKRKAFLEQKSQPQLSFIPTSLMAAFVVQMQKNLKARRAAHKKESLRRNLKEVRVKAGEITLTYNLPVAGPQSDSTRTESPRKSSLHCQRLVVAVGLEPTTSCM